MQLARLKTRIQQEVDASRKDLVQLSWKIHQNPELGWNEKNASNWLSGYLEKQGFKVERGIYNLPTAFLASYGNGKPAIAFLAEYDALPDIGHACGHNLIGVASIGAGIGAKLAADEYGGTILVMGTPAEELLGGKVVLANEGAFNGIDVAMMIHPSASVNWARLNSLACTTIDVEYFGKSAHGARQWEGINALEALVLAFNNINSIRPYLKNKSRVLGIITEGGKATNVVTEYASGKFQLRSLKDDELDEMCEKVLSCLKAAALATGSRLEYKCGLKARAMRSNDVLTQMWSKNMETLGLKVEEVDKTKDPPGSTDMGNASVLVPSIQPQIAISSRRLVGHSPEFAAAAASGDAQESLINGSKALAMTAADILAQPENLSRVKQEFEQTAKLHRNSSRSDNLLDRIDGDSCRRFPYSSLDSSAL